MAVWDAFLSEDDRKVLEKRKPRSLNGPGKRNALLIIDMQVTACGYDKPIYEQLDTYSGACGPHAWKAIPVQQELLAAARAASMPVIYSKHIFYGISGLPSAAASNNFSALNVNSDVPAEVAMQPGDLLVEKQTPSCFTFTNLQMILNNLGVDGLLVGGNSTSGCVRATCVEGMALGYKMQVIEEAVFDRIEMSHAAALFDMQFKICDVISVSDALRQIRSSAAPASAAA